MKSTSEHFEIVKNIKNSPSPKPTTRPVFKSLSQPQTKEKEKFSLNSKLQKLKQIIDNNKIEYTLTACVLLTFQIKGKTTLTKNEIINMTKKEIQTNPNKVFIIKGGQKEMVNLKNFSKRINILLNRSHYINKIIVDEEHYNFSINLKLVDIKYESILKDIISLRDLPISKIQNDDKNKTDIKSKSKPPGSHPELIELKESEREEEKNKINLSDDKHHLGRKRKMINNEENSVEKKNKQTFEVNNMDDTNNDIKTNFTNENIENNNDSIKNNIQDKEENNNNEEDKNNNNSNIKNNHNIDFNIKNNLINNNSINANHQKNNKKYNLNNINNLSNHNLMINDINNKPKEFSFNEYLLEKDSYLSKLIDKINKNPNETKRIIDNNEKIILNEIKNLEEEINLKKEQIKIKNEELSIIRTNQNLFKKYEYRGMKSISDELKALYEDYTNNLKILEHNKEIVKLLKNDKSYKILLIKKYKDLERICINLYENIYNKLCLVLDEYKNLENIINVLYKDYENNRNIFSNEIMHLAQIEELNVEYVENFKKNLKLKLDFVINDKSFKDYINEEEKELTEENYNSKDEKTEKTFDDESKLDNNQMEIENKKKGGDSTTKKLIKEKEKLKGDSITKLTEKQKKENKNKYKETESSMSKETEKENTSIESKEKEINQEKSEMKTD